MGRMTARRWIILFAALALAGLTARLGLWQLDRAAQKERLQSAIDSRRALPPLEADGLARDEAQAFVQHHRLVELRGRWQPQHTVFLENRQMQGRPGFYVLTPLQLPDGSAVVVQRGWLPRDIRDRTLVRAPPLPDGEVVVPARIAPPPSRLYDFDGGETGPIRQNLDVAAFARETGLALRPLSVLQLAPGASGASPVDAADGLARDWPAPAADVHKHYGYAFQWFALCALTMSLYVWFQVLRPRRRSA
jgi:surfeit locus 1 family protein